jgi:hypothetical protein
MTIDRPSPDILVFNPPPQSTKDFRVLHRSLTVGLMIVLAACILVLILTTIYCFNVLLRYEIYSTDFKLNAILIIGLFSAFLAAYNAILVYMLLNLEKPILVKSCKFDRSSGQLSIQQYNLFSQYSKTIELPLNIIADVQVRNHPFQLADDFLSISLMTRQSSRPVYIFQRSIIPKQIPLSIMKSLLEEVEIIREFLHLPSEPLYKIADRLKWYELIFAAPASNERLKSIEQTNDTLVCDLRSQRYRQGAIWKFDRTTAVIKIERRTLLGKSSQHINRAEIQTIALKTEFLPLVSVPNKLISNRHRKEYQKQYSAILILRDRSNVKTKNGYCRIFTSNNLSIVRDLADRIGAHLDLHSEELQSDRAIDLDLAGAAK